MLDSLVSKLQGGTRTSPTRLRRCLYCGCDRLVARGHKVVLDTRGVVFPTPVPARECADCGRLYAVDEAWNRREQLGAKRVARLLNDHASRPLANQSGGWSEVVD